MRYTIMRYTITSVEDLNTKGGEALLNAHNALEFLRNARTVDGTRKYLVAVRGHLDTFEKLFEEAAPHIKG